MNEEIKEILELFAFTDENIMFCDIVELNSKQSHLLLDYITNLQQENEMYKKELEKADSITQSCIFEGSRSAGKSYRQCLNWLKDYKSRCEKAIEYIKNLSNEPNVFGHYGIDTECKKWLLKILNGSDEK